MNPTMALMLSTSIHAERLAAANRQIQLRAARAPSVKAEKRARGSILTMIGSRLSRAADQPAAWTPRLTNYPY